MTIAIRRVGVVIRKVRKLELDGNVLAALFGLPVEKKGPVEQCHGHFFVRGIFLLAALSLSLSAEAEVGGLAFQQSYAKASGEMVPALTITDCLSITSPNMLSQKAIVQCNLGTPSALLTIDTFDGMYSGAALRVDVRALRGPSDMIRVGGILLRAAGRVSASDHLAVSADLLKRASSAGWTRTCTDDVKTSARLCVQSGDGTIFDYTIAPLRGT